MRGFFGFAALPCIAGAAAFSARAAESPDAIEVRVRQTSAGPRVFVDGRTVRPRFYYGSPANLCNMAWTWETQFNVPFRAEEDTESGRVELPLYDGEKPIDFYDADLIDLTAGATNFIGGRVRTDRYACDGLKLRKDHLYRFRVKNRADHDRTYFHYRTTYARSDGTRVELPLPYGDTLGDTVRLAADAGVDLVTFSTDNSWGCDDWWNEAGDERGFARLDELCEKLIKVNPKALLIPRVIGNAPDWFLEKHPESRMKFDRDYKVAMVSVSYRPYRKAVCEMVEKLVRHLRSRFPRNFAGLHVGGQNSAEWFYFNSQSGDLSGYDVATRNAFREYLAARGEKDAAAAEVPSPEERRRIRPGNRFDPVRDRRLVDFTAFRQMEIATLLRDIGEAIRRGSDGKCLSLFFYGYTWELSSNAAGTGEFGHNAMEWLQREGAHAVDGFSGPFSYNDRNLTGSASVMSAAETCLRRGFLWINEDDTRTCREEFWDNHSRAFTPHADRWTTEQILLRDSVSGVLRGTGEWWMDLFGRGWHRDPELWKIRKALNPIDDRLLERTRPYEPEIAVAADDASLILNAAGSNAFMTHLRRRNGYAACGGTYGQYFLDDLLSAPPKSVKLVYLVSCDLSGERGARLAAFRAAHPDVRVVEATKDNVAAEAVAEEARKAGVHLYTEPGCAFIEAAEGYVMVQARQDGPLTIDFGAAGEIRDALTGGSVGTGPKLTLGFRKGEVRLFSTVREEPSAVPLPGEPATRPALAPDPFPDRLSAYVWRNWFCVPKERLASVVGASAEDIEAIAREMGLPPQPPILPEWRRKGYITIVRRNWHLLDYDQLLETIDMDREEFRFRLKEDDFLWSKLGKVKPKCGALRWSAGMREEGRGKRMEIARILKEEGADDFTEEPRFQFVKDISQTSQTFQTSQTSQTFQTSPFDFRLIFSYFADYADPLADPEIGSFPEGLLQKLAAQGVNAVWMHTVLRTLVKDPKYPEFGEGSEARLANLRKLVARCARYGIKVYLYMNEPRSMPAEFFEKPGREGLRGAPARDGTGCTLCTSVPEVRRWVHDSLKDVFSRVKGLGGIFTITMSENLTHCDSRGGKAGCPRCKDRPTGDLIAEINRAMIEGMQAGDPDATALVWNWAWPKDEEEAIVAALPKRNVRVMAVSENAMPVRRGGAGVTVFDYSISVVGPGENALKLWHAAGRNGLGAVAKVQANCSWELSPFPYLPVMDLVAEHAHNLARTGVDGIMLSWSVGCCPAPNLSVFRDYRKGDAGPAAVLDRLAAALYGDRAAQARRAWTAFSEGFRNYPFHVVTLYFGPQHMGPANPLYPRPTGYAPTMVGFPYDGLDGDGCPGDGAARWRASYPAETWMAQMEKVAAGFRRGCELMKGVAEERELNLFRAETMHFESCVDQAAFVRARKRGDRAEMRRLARAECERAKAYLPLVRADSRIGYESSCQYFFIPQDIREKIIGCRMIEDGGGTAEAVPLITVRHTPAINDDPETFARIAGIHRANPGACDEVWFADGSIDALDGVRKTAAKIAAFREDCERSGIGLSFQHGRTLGHGPSHDGKARAAEHPFSAGDWQVGRDGRPLEGILCPRSPAVLAYARDYARTLVETVHPKTYWLDDDLRMGVCKPNGCFCDRCLKAFNAETGSSWTREPLAEKLLDSPSPEPVREAWIAFNQRSLALYAAAVREGVEEADPDCCLGYQSVWADAIYTGRDYRPLLEALSGPRHRPVGIRPGAGFYNESSPRGMVAKTLSVAREAERCRAYGFVGRICYENETYPRRILHKSPGAIVTECALALACGADSLSLYWYDGSMPEPLAEYGRFAKTVAASRPYLARLAASSARTRMIGISRFVGSAAARCRDLDLRDPCDAALALAGVPVSVEEAGFPLWYVTEKSRAEMTDADRTVLSGKTVDLPDGLVAGPFRGFLRAEERTAILDAMDRIVPGGFPVRLEECRAVRIVPRVTADGRLDSVTLLNCSIGETDELTLRLRELFRPALAWTSPRRPDRTLDAERTGADWTVRIPSLDPWQVVTVYVKEGK